MDYSVDRFTLLSRDFEPAYLSLLYSGELKRRAERALADLESCTPFVPVVVKRTAWQARQEYVKQDYLHEFQATLHILEKRIVYVGKMGVARFFLLSAI